MVTVKRGSFPARPLRPSLCLPLKSDFERQDSLIQRQDSMHQCIVYGSGNRRKEGTIWSCLSQWQEWATGVQLQQHKEKKAKRGSFHATLIDIT